MLGATLLTTAPAQAAFHAWAIREVCTDASGPLQFQFNTVTGVSYVVDCGLPLTNFSPVVTNPGHGGVLQFSETNAVPSQGTCRVRVP